MLKVETHKKLSELNRLTFSFPFSVYEIVSVAALINADTTA